MLAQARARAIRTVIPCRLRFILHLVQTLPLGKLEHLTVDGVEYEAFSTSGGIGTLHETWKDKAYRINYKTMRYPGHLEYMKFLMEDMNIQGKDLVNLLNQTVPTTTQDKVIIWVTVVGMKNEKLVQETTVQQITGGTLQTGENSWTAIQLTTAAGICAMVDLHKQGKLPQVGYVKQEEAKLSDFLGTKAGKIFSL